MNDECVTQSNAGKFCILVGITFGNDIFSYRKSKNFPKEIAFFIEFVSSQLCENQGINLLLSVVIRVERILRY